MAADRGGAHRRTDPLSRDERVRLDRYVAGAEEANRQDVLRFVSSTFGILAVAGFIALAMLGILLFARDLDRPAVRAVLAVLAAVYWPLIIRLASRRSPEGLARATTQPKVRGNDQQRPKAQ